MVKLIVSKLHYTRAISLQYFSTKPKAILDDAAATLLSNEEITHKNHPGIIKPRTPEFPKWAFTAIRNILNEKQISMREINESANQLVRHLNGRHPPIEQTELKTRLSKVEERLNVNNVSEKISIENLDFRQNAKARNIFGRGVQNYAVLYKILSEIEERDKEFKPNTLFDFGSGVGTVMWAASQIWSKSLKEYFCVDTSESMIELSEKLVQTAKPEIKEIFYRQYFPASVNPTYDIVTSAYSLFELPNTELRLETILKLWRKTDHYLIIVEQGTNAGFKLVNEARDFILKYANSKSKYGSRYAHVFSPCPHDLTCPRFATDNTPCNFAVLYQPLQFLGGKQHKSELFSYVVLKKGKRPENDKQWPRIVRTTLKRSKHMICRMCVSNGKLKEEIFTQYKHGRDIYRCAKNSTWGDRLPIHYQEDQNISEVNDAINQTTDVK